MLLISGSVLFSGCDRSHRSTDVEQTSKRLTDQQVFERKLECGKLLNKVEGSLLGPEPHLQKGITPTNPIVFYSPLWNTCMLVIANVFEGRMVVPPYSHYRKEHASVDDLLTGQTIEERDFDLNVPEQAEAARNFEEWAMKTYAPQPEGHIYGRGEIPKAPPD